ncbi:MAG: hypothetical protein WC264_00535 [Candidatus Paceibacterota bacterium]|jgi:hypothetical protein
MKTLILHFPEISTIILLILVIFLWREIIVKRKIIKVLKICSFRSHNVNEFFNKLKKLNVKSFHSIENEVMHSIELISYSDLCVLIYGGGYSESGFSNELPPKLGKVFAKIIKRKLSLMENKLFSQIFIESLERQLSCDNNPYADTLIKEAMRSKKVSDERFPEEFISTMENSINKEQDENKKIVLNGELIKIRKNLKIFKGMEVE